MEHVWLTVLGISGLLLLAVLVWPLASRLSFPYTVLLAVVGCGLGFLKHALPESVSMGAASDLLEALHTLDITSEAVLFVFLPALVFESALAIDVRRLLEDIAPILMLAVVGLLISTAVVGFSLHAVSGVGILVCLLLGAIVSATDPVAVVAIFKDLGAPKRLAILVEGESLFNDATAIVVFTILSAMVLGQSDAGLVSGVGAFLKVFFGGIAVGYLLARIATWLLDQLGDATLPRITLTLSLAYLSFLLAEHYLHVSGVMAVVTAALVLGSRGRSLFTRDAWHELEGVWEQVGFVANSVIFVLVGVAVPAILADFSSREWLWLGVLLVAAFAARFALIFGLVPLLSRLGWAQSVQVGYRAVMFWGGLRGAVSLALALAVMENDAFAPEIRTFVGTLVTAFVLFTLAVNATTVKWVMRAFGLDQLSAADQVLRQRAVQQARERVGRELETAARAAKLPTELAAEVAGPYQQEIGSGGNGDLNSETWMNLGLKALLHREQQIYQGFFDHRLIHSDISRRLLDQVNDIQDGTKGGGVEGYRRAWEQSLELGWQIRLAARAQQRLGVTSMLANRLGQRFTLLQATCMALEELAHGRVAAEVADPSVAPQLEAALKERLDASNQALECLRAAYPDYAAQLERTLLEQMALRVEAGEYRDMLAGSVINKDVYSELLQEVETREEEIRRPTLDLGLEAHRLVARMPFFADLDEATQQEVVKLLKPRLALPGEQVITQGEKGDCMYFISSGAACVLLDPEPVILGRGDFFGEMALLESVPRKVSVISEGFCDLLILATGDFNTLLDAHPALRTTIERVARERSG
ncbi:MAG: cation:proton antiporter [Pseudomonadota bacterium]